MWLTRFIFISSILLLSIAVCPAQSDVWPTLEGARREDDRPKSIKETLEKMRIDKHKKDYVEMISRGSEAVKLAGEIETAVAERGSLTKEEIEKVETVEKLVRRIRSDLGGGKVDESELQDEVRTPENFAEGIRYLKETTVDLLEELKKTTRFTISAAAIHSSNAILYIARFLRVSK